jgi:hypothetical protein
LTPSPLPPYTTPSPPTPSPAPPNVCDPNGAHDVCDDWSQAVWGDRDSEYYFYLYDETDDGQNLKFWCAHHTHTSTLVPSLSAL